MVGFVGAMNKYAFRWTDETLDSWHIGKEERSISEGTLEECMDQAVSECADVTFQRAKFMDSSACSLIVLVRGIPSGFIWQR